MNDEKRSQKFSFFSITALIAAILSFNVGAIMGLLFAAVALIFGAIGFLRALSPKVRGGVMSILSIIAGAVGVIAAIIKAIMWFA